MKHWNRHLCTITIVIVYSLRFVHNSLETVFHSHLFLKMENHKLKKWQISMSWCQSALATSLQTLPMPMNTDVTNCLNGPKCCRLNAALRLFNHFASFNTAKCVEDNAFIWFVWAHLRHDLSLFSWILFVSIGNEIVQQTAGMRLECVSVFLFFVRCLISYKFVFFNAFKT